MFWKSLWTKAYTNYHNYNYNYMTIFVFLALTPVGMGDRGMTTQTRHHVGVNSGNRGPNGLSDSEPISWRAVCFNATDSSRTDPSRTDPLGDWRCKPWSQWSFQLILMGRHYTVQGHLRFIITVEFLGSVCVCVCVCVCIWLCVCVLVEWRWLTDRQALAWWAVWECTSHCVTSRHAIVAGVLWSL